MRSWKKFGVPTLSAMALITVAGCGGSGSKTTTPPAPTTYTIGGTITGLTGTGLVLQDNGGDNLTVSANASTFTFATAVKSGGAYSVSVLTQPTGENCTLASGSGTASANVTNVTIACAAAYTIGGSVYGLTGSGLVLQDNSGNNLTVSAGATNYAFVFPGTIPADGAPYSITVQANPSGQSCTVANPIGNAKANITNANVSCTTVSGTAYTIGGTVTGLTGPGLILQDALNVNDDDLLPVNANGSFTFVDPVVSGGAYNVSVLSQPTGRNCLVNNGSGAATANVTSVVVACVGDFAWIGGSSTVGATGGQAGVYGTLGTPAPANIPGGRAQALSWTDASGNAWLFGGYGDDSTGSGAQLNDLWKYTPGTSGAAGEWTWMGGVTVAPPSVSGGPPGAPGVYGTLGTADPANAPGAREQIPSWKDASGNLWIFGGVGIDAVGSYGYLNDLWKYTPGTSGNLGQWTWVGGDNTLGIPYSGRPGLYGTLGTADPGNLPGGRYGSVTWTDASGNFWLFGGDGSDSTPYGPNYPTGYQGYLNDLWKYTPGANGTAGEWTWMGGSSTLGSNGGQSGVYGTLGASAYTNFPGGRDAAVSWTDASGNVWMFGGIGIDAAGNFGYLNDLWEYTPGSNGALGVWTWMGGSSTVPNLYTGPSGVYGTQGIPDTKNTPGGRFSPATWVDASGNLWLEGGQGYDRVGNQGYLNDLWKYTPGTNGAAGEWTWMDGSSTVPAAFSGQVGVYGILGVPGAANTPGGRLGASSWTDASGNLWLFGGQGYDATGAQGNLNDLWQYQP